MSRARALLVGPPWITQRSGARDAAGLLEEWVQWGVEGIAQGKEDMMADMNECCARFDPEPWDEKEITWEDKQFVKDRVRSFLHIPLNFQSVMVRNVGLIEAAGAKPDRMIVLADENSLWGADVYLEVSKHVPNAHFYYTTCPKCAKQYGENYVVLLAQV